MTTVGPLLGVVFSWIAASGEPDAKDILSLDHLYSYPRIVGTAPVDPTWSPDSRKFAFLWNDSGYDFRDIYVTHVESGVTSRLTSSSASSPPAEGDPGIVEVSFHPDSERLLYELAGELYLFEPGAIPQPIARGSRGRFSPDGRKLAFLEGGNLWIATLGSESDPRPLVSDPRTEVFVESFEWAPEGERIAFLETDERRVPVRGIPDYLEPEVNLVPVRRPFPGEEPRSQRLGIVSAKSGEPEPAFLDLGGEPVDPIFSYRWSSRGQLLVDTSDLYVKRRRILVIDPAREAVDVVYREDAPENVTAHWQAEWSVDGNTIYFLSDRDDDYHVYTVPSAGGEPRRITSGDFAVSDLAVTTDALIFVANAPRPEERQVFRVGVSGGEPVQLSQEPGTHAPVVSPDGRHAAVSFSSDLMPPELFLTALDSQLPVETRLTHSPLPGFDFENWFRPEYVTFESHVDGATIHGRLLVPSTLDRGKKHPVIVGSIYANTVRNQWGGRNAHPLWGLERHLLDKGYVLFNMDVRGSWGHGKAFRRGIRLDYGGIDVEDIESGVRYLSSLLFVDAERVGIWGSSYGGLLASMSLFKKPGLFRAGVAAAPATNVFHALTGEMRVMMAPQDQAAAYEAASAFTHAEGLRDPLLIIHGMRDRVVLYKDSLSLVERLMRLGRNVDLVTLPDAGHGWDLEELYQTRFAFRKLVDFFDLHLTQRGPAAASAELRRASPEPEGRRREGPILPSESEGSASRGGEGKQRGPEGPILPNESEGSASRGGEGKQRGPEGPILPNESEGSASRGGEGKQRGPEGPILPNESEGSASRGGEGKQRGPEGPILPNESEGSASRGGEGKQRGPEGPILPSESEGSASRGGEGKQRGPEGPILPNESEGSASRGGEGKQRGPEGPILPNESEGSASRGGERH